MNEILRKNLKLAIKGSGIKWGKVAQSLNITYPYLWRMLKGDRRLKPEIIFQISLLTKTSLNKLYGVDET